MEFDIQINDVVELWSFGFKKVQDVSLLGTHFDILNSDNERFTIPKSNVMSLYRNNELIYYKER